MEREGCSHPWISVHNDIINVRMTPLEEKVHTLVNFQIYRVGAHSDCHILLPCSPSTHVNTYMCTHEHAWIGCSGKNSIWVAFGGRERETLYFFFITLALECCIVLVSVFLYPQLCTPLLPTFYSNFDPINVQSYSDVEFRIGICIQAEARPIVIIGLAGIGLEVKDKQLAVQEEDWIPWGGTKRNTARLHIFFVVVLHAPHFALCAPNLVFTLYSWIPNIRQTSSLVHLQVGLGIIPVSLHRDLSSRKEWGRENTPRQSSSSNSGRKPKQRWNVSASPLLWDIT